MASFGMFLILFILSIKSPESLTTPEDQLLCMIGLRWLSRNFDAFSVGLPQLEMNGLLVRYTTFYLF